MKENGFTKEDILRNIDFAFLTEKEKEEKIKESMKKFVSHFMDGLNEALSKEEDKGK